MAIDFNRTFGASSNQTNGADREDGPKATLWLNVGYDSGVPEQDDPSKTRFVSLPVGIPVDTLKHVPANSRNSDYAKFQAARNDLLDQIVAAGNALQPGETATLNLTIQLRKVEDERAPASTGEDNQFVKPIQLVAA